MKAATLGVFGGTFNPIHVGHLRAAEEVRCALGLGQVVFVPARMPPHKDDSVALPAEFRWRAVQEAVRDNPFFEASDVELGRSGPSYSVDTLEELRRGRCAGTAPWFLVGSDAFAEIHTWHRFEALFRLADVAVMSRPPLPARIPLPAALRPLLQPQEDGYRHPAGHAVRWVEVTALDISSTRIRQLLHTGGSVRYLVPEGIRGDLERAAHDHPEWFARS